MNLGPEELTPAEREMIGQPSGRLVDHDDERDPARARDVHYFMVDP
jgi:hypothetical protein